MSSLIKNLHIKNFKSVRDLSLECDRINIFIGKPNAGKSNILEAISLLGAGYSGKRFMDGFIRYTAIIQLFRDFDLNKKIEVIADETEMLLNATKLGDQFYFSIHPLNEDQSEAAIEERLLYENTFFRLFRNPIRFVFLHVLSTIFRL